jgi:hypothetical protein
MKKARDPPNTRIISLGVKFDTLERTAKDPVLMTLFSS